MNEKIKNKKEVKNLPKKNVSSAQKWQTWQGREDAEMLIEKQSNWHCRPDSSDDFGDED